MRAWHGGDRRTDRLLSGIYRASAIDRRHSVVRDFVDDDAGGFLYDPQEREFLVPGTARRNELYADESGKLASEAARDGLERAGTEPSSVTHLITVSCTGFFAPGPDIELVERLCLRREVERYHIGFMGCYGAFPALRLARSICLAHPDAVVLVVSVELCTLHLQASNDSDSLLAGSVFADGAAAAVVGSTPGDGAELVLDSFANTLVPGARDEMAWTVGDTGFEMKLSGRIPAVIECEARDALAPLLDKAGLAPDQVAQWAVHPGGRAILDRFESALGLEDGSLWASREVLRRYGNMSSATVLFVLERIISEGADNGPIAALAFGPGLAVESALLTPSAS